MSGFTKRRTIVLGLIAVLQFCALRAIDSQSLLPRAYLITPLHSNTINLGYSFYGGGLDFNGVVSVDGATGTYSVPTVGYYHSVGMFGQHNEPRDKADKFTYWSQRRHSFEPASVNQNKLQYGSLYSLWR